MFDEKELTRYNKACDKLYIKHLGTGKILYANTVQNNGLLKISIVGNLSAEEISKIEVIHKVRVQYIPQSRPNEESARADECTE